MIERLKRARRPRLPAGAGRTAARPRQVTLARALSKLGHASRAQARSLIAAGRVSVDGRAVRDPDRWVDLCAAEIRVDERVVEKRRHLYFAMHKPAGYVTTRSDERSRSTVYDLLGEHREWVFPVGRLDRDTSGLLVFTNDTEFGEALTNPDAHVAKSYLVCLDRPLADADAREMRSGMELADGTRLRPASIARAGGEGSVFEVTIDEGKNRQLRRMCAELGYRVLALHRFRIGSLELGALPEGATRPLAKAEVDALRPGRRRRG